MVKVIRRLRKNKKGAALVEYALIIAGVALIGAVERTVEDYFDLIELVEARRGWKREFDVLANRSNGVHLHVRNRNNRGDANTQRKRTRCFAVD